MFRSHRKSVLTAALFGAALAATAMTAGPATANDDLVVRDFVLTNAVVGHEPTNEANGFTVQDQKAYAFARIQNTGEPTTVNVVWHYEGTQHGSVSLNVGKSPGWRTWSSANLKPGNWSVTLVDAEGSVLVQRSFTVAASVDSMAKNVQPMIDDPMVTEPTSTATKTDESMFYPVE